MSNWIHDMWGYKHAIADKQDFDEAWGSSIQPAEKDHEAILTHVRAAVDKLQSIGSSESLIHDFKRSYPQSLLNIHRETFPECQHCKPKLTILEGF